MTNYKNVVLRKFADCKLKKLVVNSKQMLVTYDNSFILYIICKHTVTVDAKIFRMVEITFLIPSQILQIA